MPEPGRQNAVVTMASKSRYTQKSNSMGQPKGLSQPLDYLMMAELAEEN